MIVTPLLILIGLIITGIACSIVYLIFIMPKQIKKEVEEEMKKIQKHRDQTKVKLNEKLINICSLFNIPLEYNNNLEETAGHILYHRDRSGRILLDDCKIEVLEKYQNEPWVLAHELGHYIAMNKLQDNSEKMADKMAKEICCTLLSKREQKEIDYSLDAYFE